MLTVFVTYRYFLGLRTLTVIHDAVEFVAQTTGKHIDIDALDYNDPQVFASIGTGRTDGIFQLESGGMRNFMKELRPRNLEDIIDGISLYRPGPMDSIPKYIKSRSDKASVTYACPQLEPILAPTHGCIIYQEQVMQIVRDLGGYTMGRSDLVRRAMSKKKHSVMEKERVNFIHGNEAEGVPGCVSKGISEQVANGIFDDMIDFAEYAFNKSHAAGYAVVAYQTAYLKYYYPVEFMAALMTSVIDNPKKVAEYILTCRGMGTRMLPPDINQGQCGFSVCDGSIRYALTAIKSVGRPVIEGIIEERRAGGPFANLKDFITRTAEKDVNKRVLENLIKAGALDSLGGTRKQFMSVYVQILDSITKDKKNNLAGQISLFDIADDSQKEEFDIRMPDVGEYTKEMVLAFEKEVLGIYLSGHPLESYQELWQKYITNTTNDFVLDEETGSIRAEDQATAIVGGLIADKTIKYTKNDKVMAFLNLEDLVGNVEIVVFPGDYERYNALLSEDAKIFVKGRVSVEEDKDGKLICEQIAAFEEAAQVQGGPLFRNRYDRGGRGGGRSYGGGPAPGTSAGYGGNRGSVAGYGSGPAPDASAGYGGNRGSAAGYEGGPAPDASAGYGGSWSGAGTGGSGRSAPPQPARKKVPNGIWIQFPSADNYFSREQELLSAIADSSGNDDVVVYLRDTKAYKPLPPDRRVSADAKLQQKLGELFGSENVKIRNNAY